MSKHNLDNIEASLTALMRIAKRPGYWEELQSRADTTIDRPAAAILIILSKCPANFQTVVSRMGIEPPSVSRKVHELEQKGLIKRQPTEDKRVHQLELSEEGMAIASRLLNAKRSLYQDVFKAWSTDEVDSLDALLEKLTAGMKDYFENKGAGK
jgi:DNA-binding MarR family transcriptional regulator